jgi:phosphotransferase system HPr (HPr) family protein
VSPSSEREARLPDAVALHARAAGALARAAAAHRCDIAVEANGRRANAKSILELLALGATAGTSVEISASGEGAAEAVDHLALVVPTLG